MNAEKTLETLQAMADEARSMYFKFLRSGLHSAANMQSQRLADLKLQIDAHLNTQYPSLSNHFPMSKYPQSTYVTGVFKGVYPVQQVTADFAKQQFAIDTEEEFHNIKVFEATRTSAGTDTISEVAKFTPGDLVKVHFNLRSVKSQEGKWFTNVVAWRIQAYVPQDTSDFQAPESTTKAPASFPPTGTDSADDLPF